ncbi:MAG: four helix bundle protein [Bacteroidetes bacterium]|nr:four helix bundle protein [Bacteroidota bacterium]
MRKHNYKELKIWIKSRELVKSIYVLSAKFPEEEKFGVTSQIRRAVVSVNLNIVEGSGRKGVKDFSNFLNVAYSSLLEVEGLLILTIDLEFVQESEVDELFGKVTELLKMIYSFREGLEK